MDKIIIKKQEGKPRARRATVVVKPETYKRITEISIETNHPIETITNILDYSTCKTRRYSRDNTYS